MSGAKDDCHQLDECLCVGNQGAFVDSFVDVVSRLLIRYIYAFSSFLTHFTNITNNGIHLSPYLTYLI